MIARAFDVSRNEGLLALVRKAVTFLQSRVLPFSPEEHHLVLQLANNHVKSRVMIDVGAATGSSLAPFVTAGWSVYALEPDSENRAKLERVFRNRPNVFIDPRAAAMERKGEVPFYASDDSIGISSLIPFDASHRLSGTVDTIDLRSFMADYQIGRVGFLKVDTEGYDLLVLKGFPWEVVQPEVVMCEFDDQKTRAVGYGWQDLARFLKERGYIVLISEWKPLVRYGGGHQWRGFDTFPCTLKDPSSWGNLIGVRSSENQLYLEDLFRSFERNSMRLARFRSW